MSAAGARLGLALWLCIGLAGLGLPGCASPQRGFYYTVGPGENLYRIGRRFEVPVPELVRINRIRDVTRLPVGARLWIPKGGGRPPTRTAKRSSARPAPASTSRRPPRPPQRSDLAFVWPLQGRLTSRFGRRGGRPHEGIDLAARNGTPIRAAESGRVIYSGRLGGYGKVVVVKHTGSYRSVYAHASALHVRKGDFVAKGDRIASVGATGRASGPHLHFEIRRGKKPSDPMQYLP